MLPFPKCHEGFRRLSAVAAILVCLAGLGVAAVAHSSAVSSAKYKCAPEYADIYNCSGADLETCKAQMVKNQPTCLAANDPPFSNTLLWLLAVAVATYLAALIVRSLGWIVQGFLPHG